MKISEQMGHNQPNAYDALKERTDSLIEIANRWISERPEILDQDMADKAKDFLDQLREEGKAVESARKIAKQPHMDAAAGVDGTYKPLGALLKTAADMIKPRMTDWLVKQQAIKDEIARAAAELAERKLQEAALLEAPETVEEVLAQEGAVKAAEQAQTDAKQASADNASTQGQLGGKAMSLRTRKAVEIVDMDLVFAHYGHREEVENVLTRLAAADVRSGLEVPGIKIIETATAV